MTEMQRIMERARITAEKAKLRKSISSNASQRNDYYQRIKAIDCDDQRLYEKLNKLQQTFEEHGRELQALQTKTT